MAMELPLITPGLRFICYSLVFPLNVGCMNGLLSVETGAILKKF